MYQSQWLYLVAIARPFGSLLTVVEGAATTKNASHEFEFCAYPSLCLSRSRESGTFL